ncbi:MAG: beta-propeller domain-containing protein [Nocardioidaceae bacterium]|nr:MAG: beta-propeller domain-containing protein [Nocardioidaceae bacterium]
MIPQTGEPLASTLRPRHMRKPLIALGGLTALGLLAVPIVQGGDTDKPTPFSASSAAADDQLPAFADCDELLDWYVEQALPLVGPYGFGWGYGYYARNFAVSEDSVAGTAKAPVPAPVPAAVPDSAVSSSDTGTNVQEQGVDEPDFAKTNGSIIVRIHDRDLVITDITGDQPVTLSSTRFPRKVYPEQLLLVGNRVLVLGTAESHGGPVPLDYGGRALVDTVMAPWGGNTELFTFDISDPENPELVDRTTYEGRAVEARQYGDVVRLVLSSGLPEFDFVQPTRRRTEAQAERMNKKIVRESTITDWLPSKVPGGQLEGGERVPLVDCEQVRHPKQDKETAGEAGTRLAMGQEAELGNLSIVTLSAATPESHQAVTITTNATQAYSSQGHLYVATTEYVQGQIARDLPLNDQDDLDDTASSDMGSDDMGTDNAEDIGEEVVTEPAAPLHRSPSQSPDRAGGNGRPRHPGGFRQRHQLWRRSRRQHRLRQEFRYGLH